MTICMMYKSGFNSLDLFNDGIWNLNTVVASLFSIVSPYPIKFGLDSKFCDCKPNSRCNEVLELIFDFLVLGVLLVVLTMSFWRWTLKRSAANSVPKATANNSGLASNSSCLDVRVGYPDLDFDLGYGMLLASYHSCLFVSCTRLVASDGAANDYFGHSVSLSGDYALIGSVGENDYQGSAYVYFKSNSDWNEVDSIGWIRIYFFWNICFD